LIADNEQATPRPSPIDRQEWNMPPRTQSDEKYILDLVARVLAEPDYRWQHRFPTLLGDPDLDGKQMPLPVDGYFPRHRLIIEYWERQHSAPVPIMDEGMTVSGVSRGDQRRLYDQRRQAWANANEMRLVILDYRGFETDNQGRLVRDEARDLQAVADALQTAGVLSGPGRSLFDQAVHRPQAIEGCSTCRMVQGEETLPENLVVWRSVAVSRHGGVMAFLDPAPPLFGYTLVAPLDHREQVTGDFTLVEFLEVQRVVYAVAEAVRLALEPERVYVLSLGSQQTDAHVCWRIVPCLPGVPFEQQQLGLIDRKQRGVVEMSPEEGAALAARIRDRLPAWMRRG
jgi:ATP adenylyltransferase